MHFSVVIPTWNRAQSVCNAIQSVKAQTLSATEIIVVDDGSTDDTKSILKRIHPDVQLIQQSNSGVSSARNAGIKAASGDWIALLDSDDEWLPDKLKSQAAYLRSHSEIRLVHCDEIWIRNGVRVNPKTKHKKRGGWIYAHCLPLCAISPSAAVIRRDVFDTIGFFDESLPACEDYDYWLRFCAQEPVGYVEEFHLQKFGGHADQLSQAHWGMDRFRMQALAKAMNSGTLDNTLLELTRKQLEEKLRIFIQGAVKRGNEEFAISLQEQYAPLLTNPLN